MPRCISFRVQVLPELEVRGGAGDAPWKGVMSDRPDLHRRRDRDQDLVDEREPLRRRRVEHKGAPANMSAQSGQPSAAAAPPSKPKGPPVGVTVNPPPPPKPKGPPAGVTVQPPPPPKPKGPPA
eukprot:2583697-Amphidinium_carterae.1